jgi:hypothetical protein
MIIHYENKNESSGSQQMQTPEAAAAGAASDNTPVEVPEAQAAK